MVKVMLSVAGRPPAPQNPVLAPALPRLLPAHDASVWAGADRPLLYRNTIKNRDCLFKPVATAW